MALPEILERLGVFHPLQFDGPSLINTEIIGRAALTPTDLLHLTGEFDPWDKESAMIAASLVARIHKLEVEELIQAVKTHMAERIVAEIVSFLTGQSLTRSRGIWDVNLGSWLFEASLYDHHPHLRNEISLKSPIIGIGAPAGIFLPKVAELLRTELILPDHYEVANAVGAVAGSVMAQREAWIIPRSRGVNVVGFITQAGGQRDHFTRLESALSHAKEVIAAQAVRDAMAAGAIEPSVEIEQLPDGAESYRLRATAIGNPALGAHE
jgi:N-methylhydantoinase A/oxoprolinase/acetone carboxylase beta subunit